MAAMKLLKPLLLLTLLTTVKVGVAADAKQTSEARPGTGALYTRSLPHDLADERSHDVHSTSNSILPAHNDQPISAYNPSDHTTTSQTISGHNIEQLQTRVSYGKSDPAADEKDDQRLGNVEHQHQILPDRGTELSVPSQTETTNEKTLLSSGESKTLLVRPESRKESAEIDNSLGRTIKKFDGHVDVSNDYDQEQLRQFKSRGSNVQQITRISGHTLLTSDVGECTFSKQTSCNVTQSFIDCTCRDLNRVPVLKHPDSVKKFFLQYNLIPALIDNAFINYTKITHLDLSCNRITVLESNAFVGLTNLLELSLWNNSLIMIPDTFPPDVFKPLVSLKVLSINRNNPNIRNMNCTYPDEALSILKNLRELHLDGAKNQDFGQGFGQLTKLTNLSLQGYHKGYCCMWSLRNTTFQYLSQVRHLDISNCYIYGYKIQSGAFLPLKNLISLNLTHNEDIDIKSLDNVLYGLRQIPTLKELSMRLIINRYSLGICLDSYYIRNLPQHLEYLDFGENNLEAVDRNVTRLLSPSLTRLDVSGNRFVFGTYLRDLKFMGNLTEFKFNGAGFTYNLPQLYPFQVTGPHSHNMAVNGEISNCTLYAEDDPMYFYENGTFVLNLPPNLKRIEMNKAGLNYILSTLTVNANNSLEEVIMQHNDFPYLDGPFIGLHKLRYLDVSRSFVKRISSNFFLNLTSLRKVNLGGNLLGDFLSGYDGGDLFSSLESLTFLNLSFNAITIMSSNVFNGLYSLETLLLGKNNIEYLDANLSFMNNLQVLDLRDNRISYLPIVTRDHISSLLNDHINITVNLKHCPIMCDCPNLAFIIWMTTSGAFDKRFKHYRCQYPDTSSKDIRDGYNNTIMLLTRECTPHTIMFFIVGSCMFVIVCIIICAILYRFRWKIRYLYYAAYLQYKRKGNNSEEHFEYDAFISYDQEDENFVERKLTSELERRGLKLCIHGRDFRAGEYIASNVVRAVCASRRTVVVLTRHMMNSYWCGYEIQMANMESVHTGRPVLIFLLMEKIPESELGVELLYNIRNNTYIPYPDPLPDATSIGRLWDKLAADIRTQ